MAGPPKLHGFKKTKLVIGNTFSDIKTADYVCSGSEDQTVINNAIQALPAEGGKIILNEGEYYINQPIVPNINNLEIVGAGIGKTIIRSVGDFHAGIFHDRSASAQSPRLNLTIRRMTLDGSSMVKDPDEVNNKGIFVTHLRRAIFENLHVYNTGSTGIGVDFLIDSIIRNNVVEKCGCRSAHTGNSGIGIGTGDDAEEPLIIIGNHVLECGLAGIMLEAQKKNSEKFLHHIISNNVVRECHQWGVLIRGLRRVIISSNIIVGNEKDGIGIETYFSNPPADILVSSNIVQSNGGFGLNIYSEDAQDLQVVCNNFKLNEKGPFASQMSEKELSRFANEGDMENKIRGNLCVSGGIVTMEDLPQTDPQRKGQLWNDRGTLKISC